MDRYGSDGDNEEATASLLTEYSTNGQQLHRDHQPQLFHQNTELCSPVHSINSSGQGGTTVANNFQGVMPSSRTNPFSSKYDVHTPTGTDSLSEHISFSGSSSVLDRLQAAAELNAANTSAAVAAAYLIPSAVNPTGSSLRSSRSKSGRLNRSSGMTSSSSATSSNSNATLSISAAAALTNRNEREKLKLKQLQMELRDFAQCDSDVDQIAMESEPPPEPAPPEIPPRTQSLLMSLRKRSDYQLKFQENGDQKHEQFIPANQQQHLEQNKDKGKIKAFSKVSFLVKFPSIIRGEEKLTSYYFVERALRATNKGFKDFCISKLSKFKPNKCFKAYLVVPFCLEILPFFFLS